MKSQEILSIIVLIIPLFIAIAAFNIARKRNRNGWLWFFVCLLTSLLGLIVLACSSKLEYDEDLDYRETDTLGWIMLVVGVIWTGLTFWYGFTATQEYNSIRAWDNINMFLNWRH